MVRFAFFALALLGLTIGSLVGGVNPSSGTPHRISQPSEPRKPTELLRKDDGHFYTYAKVNGEMVYFLVDTGSTGVALTEADAARVGIDTNPNSYHVVGEGAAGPVSGKLATLDSVELDGKLVNDVSGAVLQGSSISLLGQSYLSRMGEVQMTGDYMVLR